MWACVGERSMAMDGGFAKDFIWGASTAANQYEGGYNEGGKGLSVQDV